METGPEKEIVKRVQGGDREAFALLVDQYKAPVFKLAYDLTNDYQDARDLTQEAFLKAFASLDRFDPERRFFPWLYTIALNLVRNHMKRKKRVRFESLEEKSEIHHGPADGSPETHAALAEEMEALNDLVGRLPWKYREAIIMRFYQEMSFEEMAEVLGLSLSGAKMRVHRALARLRKFIEGASVG